MSEKLFSKKIRYLYEALDYSHKEFTKLFWDGQKKSWNSRNTTVHNSWLGEEGIDQVKGFYFDDYTISKYKVFTKECFTHNSFETFKEKADAFIEQMKNPRREFEYRFLYYYDVN